MTRDIPKTGAPTVTFTGPSAASVTLTLKTLTDRVVEDDGESVEIGLGTLDARSGTGLDGGARGEAAPGTFSVIDPTLTVSGMTGPITDLSLRMVIFAFPEPVTGFDSSGDVTVEGGATEGGEVRRAHVEGGSIGVGIHRPFIRPEGGKDLRVTVKANAAMIDSTRAIPDRPVTGTSYRDPCGGTSADPVSMVRERHRENRDRPDRGNGGNWRRSPVAFGAAEPGPAAAPLTVPRPGGTR